jgi:hypothetical protein
LPNLTQALGHDKKHSIVSLYLQSGVRHHICIHEGFCGVASLIFWRNTLDTFLSWMQPIWKELPIDWMLEDFLDVNNMAITIHPSVKHIGKTSSFKKRKRWEGEQGIRNGYKYDCFAYQKPEIAEIAEIIHLCEPTTQLVVFGIPTLPRFHNPHYLLWMLKSMRQNCVKLNQIFVYLLCTKRHLQWWTF